MYRLEPADFIRPRFIALWGLLGFQSGFINSFGFLACHRFVSHVTGFGSHVGISLGEGNFWTAFELFTAPVSFVCGAWFNGALTAAPSSRGKVPRYDLVTMIIPILILIVMIGGMTGFFGHFGEALSFKQDFLLLNTLTFLCGMQNACFATLTKGQIRTTHLTGLSTDMGTDLALKFHGMLSPEELRSALFRNLSRAVTFMCFSMGALLSALIDSIFLYSSLVIPLLTSIGVAALFAVNYHRAKPPLKS